MCPSPPHEPCGSEQWRRFLAENARTMGIDVTDRQLEQFSIHARELARWNKTVNLTAITDPAESAIKHFLDAMVPAPFIDPGGSLLDIGTGAGFPGIPLKVLVPSIALTLVESSIKRVTFLGQVVRLLSLESVTILHRRVEQVPRPPETPAFDTVICRAFASLTAFVAAALPLAGPSGQLIAMKGSGYKKELDALRQSTIKLPSGKPATASDVFDLHVHAYSLPVAEAKRVLIILKKRPSIAA
ncbi:MAG: 16S rRNA (guanine(527)-N(7))-methyltransferase RsmG [Thermodesulfobacteriota bacterium]